MSDPNPLLSTLSQSSAAMVAIIGGFLVSRLVALSSEREGIKRQLRSVRDHLALAQADYKPVHAYRLENSKDAFVGFVLDDLVVKAEAEAEAEEVGYEGLAADNVPRGSSFDEMLPYAMTLNIGNKIAISNYQLRCYLEST